MAARISARLDEATQAKLKSLQAQTHKSVTELITEALDLYYRQVRTDVGSGNQALVGLAGIFEGPADLSARYKDEFAEGFDDKFADHH